MNNDPNKRWRDERSRQWYLYTFDGRPPNDHCTLFARSQLKDGKETWVRVPATLPSRPPPPSRSISEYPTSKPVPTRAYTAPSHHLHIPHPHRPHFIDETPLDKEKNPVHSLHRAVEKIIYHEPRSMTPPVVDPPAQPPDAGKAHRERTGARPVDQDSLLSLRQNLFDHLIQWKAHQDKNPSDMETPAKKAEQDLKRLSRHGQASKPTGPKYADIKDVSLVWMQQQETWIEEQLLVCTLWYVVTKYGGKVAGLPPPPARYME